MKTYNIQVFDAISPAGLASLPKERYKIDASCSNADAVILRSKVLAAEEVGASVCAVARSGAGVNNIPVDKLTERGIAVFNTPGANANAVKELALAALFLASRNIIDAFLWTRTLTAAEPSAIDSLVEKGKKSFSGPEIRGKTLGVIGLGAIGATVANDALALGMEVEGYDPYISVNAAWSLSREVKRAVSLESLLSHADYITLHLPLTPETRGMLGREAFSRMKSGAKLLNFARKELVDERPLITALESGALSCYITDFPTPTLLASKNAVCLPHLGASTPEAEENCAAQAVKSIKDFLENGTIKNSVNLPDCRMERRGGTRLVVINRNVPNMVGQITSMLAASKINILDMLNHHKAGYACTIIDAEGGVTDEIAARLSGIEGILKVRVIE